jgi:hypothetical protein
VLLTSGNPGRNGNVAITETVASTGFVVTGMSAGLGFDCAAGVGCVGASDCASGVCCLASAGCLSAPGKCLASTCSDSVTNGGETDVDCGGQGAASCAACGNGKACNLDQDCVSGLCDATGTCVDGCGDGTKDGHETDVDCGGICSTACAAGKACAVGADCSSGTCGVPDGGTTKVCS